MNLTRRHLFALAAISVLIVSVGCSDRDPASLPLAQGDTEPLIFDDALHPDVYFQPFFETHYTAMSVDSVFAYEGFAPDGARSLKFNVPAVGSALGPYFGGVLTSGGSRNLSDYNALTFYARASQDILLNTAGFGNDNTGNSLYEAGRSNVPLTTDWTFVVVPIPDASRLLSERGMLTLAEGAEAAHPEGYDVWLDEIRFANLSNIEVFRPSMTSATLPYFIGSTVAISGASTVYLVDGAFIPVNHSPNYFDYAVSDPAVAKVDKGLVKVVGAGTATVTATLGDFDVLGQIALTAYDPPTVAPARPTLPAGDVISMYSDAYDDVPVDTWRTDWGGSTTRLEDFTVAGNPVRMYSALNFVGIEFLTNQIDASQMTHLHFDVFGPAGTNFKVKLVTFPDGTGAESQDLVLDATSTPAYTAGVWSSLDIPLADFDVPETGWDWAFVGQMILSSSDSKLILVDNIYFHR